MCIQRHHVPVKINLLCGSDCTLLRRSDFLVAVLVFPPFLLGFTDPDLSGVASSACFHAATALWETNS